MKYILAILLLLVSAPAHAETLSGSDGANGRAQPVENTYVAANQIIITTPLPADIVAAGITLRTEVPVKGDVLALAGTLDVGQGASGNVRVLGGKVTVHGAVNGDIAAAAGTLGIYGSARTIYAAGGSVDVQASSTGAAKVYGANVTVGGTYGGDVIVTASNRLTVLPGTHILGRLIYSAPQQLSLPPSVVVDGGLRYDGSYAYVPTTEQVHQYAMAGAGIFFIVRVIAACVVAGLLAGLFPRAVNSVSTRIVTRDPLRILKLLLLGIGVVIFTPILLLLLFVSLVGAALSLLLSVLYALLLILAYTSTGIVLGFILRRFFLFTIYGTREFRFEDALIGTILIHFLGFLGVVGTILTFLFACLCMGALLTNVGAALFPNLPPRLTRARLRAYVEHT